MQPLTAQLNGHRLAAKGQPNVFGSHPPSQRRKNVVNRAVTRLAQHPRQQRPMLWRKRLNESVILLMGQSVGENACLCHTRTRTREPRLINELVNDGLV